MGTAAAERGVVDLIAERVVDADDAGRTAYRVQERFDEPPPLQLSGQHDHTVVHRDIDRGQIKVAPSYGDLFEDVSCAGEARPMGCTGLIDGCC